MPADPALAAAAGVAVSPGGDSVYVASGGDDSISHFLRELPQPVRCGGKEATRVGTGGRNVSWRPRARRQPISADANILTA